MVKQRIVYVAEAEVTPQSGMGRVAWYWQRELERRGYEFTHIGLNQVGKLAHRGLFPAAARKVYTRSNQPAALLLVHEPAAGAFTGLQTPIALLSHGLERRAWNLALQQKDGSTQPVKWRTRLLFPLWRLRNCDLGLKHADLLLLINQEDCEFAQQYYRRSASDIYLFKNGITPSAPFVAAPDAPFTILFTGTWLDRKGVKTLAAAADRLRQRQIYPRWLLAGTAREADKVLPDWPAELHPYIQVVPRFQAAEESQLLQQAHLFVLPSFFEGQSLALLQAMAAGHCCITTNCCGQKDVIQTGETGLLFEPGDAAALASLIEKCMTQPDLRIQIGDRARASVQHRTWERVAAEVADRLEALIAPSGSSPSGSPQSSSPLC